MSSVYILIVGLVTASEFEGSNFKSAVTGRNIGTRPQNLATVNADVTMATCSNCDRLQQEVNFCTVTSKASFLYALEFTTVEVELYQITQPSKSSSRQKIELHGAKLVVSGPCSF